MTKAERKKLEKRRRAEAERLKRLADGSKIIASPIAPSVNPAEKNSQDAEAEAQNKPKDTNHVVSWRKRIMDIAIYASIAVAGIFGIMLALAIWKHHEMWILWCTYFAIVFTILIPFLAWQKKALDKPRGITTAAKPDITLADSANLPSIGIQGFRIITLETGQLIYIQAILQNNGPTTAYKVRMVCALAFGYPPIPQPLIIPVTNTNLRDISITDIEPGANRTIPLTSADKISRAERDEILNGKQLLYLVGKGIYYDGLEKCHPAQFCAYYSHETGRFTVCPESVKYEHQQQSDLLRCPPN